MVNSSLTLKWQTLSFLGADKLTTATRLLENSRSTIHISSLSPKLEKTKLHKEETKSLYPHFMRGVKRGLSLKVEETKWNLVEEIKFLLVAVRYEWPEIHTILYVGVLLASLQTIQSPSLWRRIIVYGEAMSLSVRITSTEWLQYYFYIGLDYEL